MNNEVTFTFTLGQLLWSIGGICIIILIIVLIRLVIEAKKTLREYREVAYNINEMIDDIQTTKMVVVDRIAGFKKMTDVVKKFQEFKEKRERRKLKKNQKTEENKGEI